MRPTKEDYDRYIWLVQRGQAAWAGMRRSWPKTAPCMVADPTLTFILLRANRDLSAMLHAMGEDVTEIERWTERLAAGAETLRNPQTGHFDAVNLRSGAHTGHLTSASFLCWYAGLDDARMAEALAASFASCRYPIASLDVGSPDFEGMRYWRGPTWAIMNTLIGLGLADMGHGADAARLRLETRRLIAEHGFAEYFHPDTGAPAGGGTFTWTAAVWLAWASPSAGDG